MRELDNITKILQYEMHNEMSMHPKARLICEIASTFRMQELSECDKQIHIERRDTGDTLFAGYVEDVILEECQQGYYVLDMTLVGGSILLDQGKKYRSYQDVALKHQDIIEKVIEDTPKVTINCVLTDDKEINKPLLQFEETSWEFINRVASRLNEPIFVDETISFPYVYVGRKSGCSLGRSVNARLIGEGMDARFYRLGELAKKNGRAAYYFYMLAGNENYYIGEQVVYNGLEFYVCEKKARLEQEELFYTYTLAQDSYMKVPKLYNSRLTGASILGDIKKVSGETMELGLHLKDEAESSVRYAYDWRPEVGNLMYCMPKEGTVVSLYFPSHDEQDAYAINCVRKIQEDKEQLFDETTKTFLTESGKLMAMATSALHLCAVNSESEKSYAQLSMIDKMMEAVNASIAEVVSEPEVEVEDIIEKMGLMLAGGHNIHMVGSNISLEGAYVDLFAGGKVSLMISVEEENSKGNSIEVKASIELLAAYFSITADEEILFELVGRVGDNTFCVIWDEPKTAANTGALIGNFILGAAIAIGIGILCVAALPVALGGLVAAGTITAATASAITIGAAVGATATGVWATIEQTKKDIKNGEASSLLDTALNVGIKSVFGAIEGGFMAIAGAGSIVAEGSRFWCQQTLKNMGKKLVINQAGAFISSSGNVLIDAVSEEGVTREKAINHYCEGFVGGLFSGILDIGGGIPWEKIPLVDKTSKWVNQSVVDKVKNTSLYQSFQKQIDKSMKWAGYYGKYDKYGNADARLANNISSNESALVRAENNLAGLSDEITNASGRVTSMQEDLDALMNRQAEIGEQLANSIRGVDAETDELIADLMGERYYRNGEQKYFEQRVQDALQRLNTLTNRQLTNQNRIASLNREIAQDTATRKMDRWGTFAVCSVLKFIDNGIQDIAKKQEPIPAMIEGAKEVGQWLFEE